MGWIVAVFFIGFWVWSEFINAKYVDELWTRLDRAYEEIERLRSQKNRRPKVGLIQDARK